MKNSIVTMLLLSDEVEVVLRSAQIRPNLETHKFAKMRQPSE